MIELVRVHGKLATPDGAAGTGVVVFELLAALIDSIGNVVVEPREVEAALDDEGRILDVDGVTLGLELAASSAPGLNPASGNGYRVTIKLDGSRPREFIVPLPYDAPVVDLADLVPADATGLVWISAATDADLADEAAARQTADVALDGRLDAVEAAAVSLDGRLDAIETLGPLATDAELDQEADDRDAAIEAHRADTTNVHGIADTAALVVTTDPRLADTRTPTDGSVTTAKIADANVTPAKLSFDPATQVELDAAVADLETLVADEQTRAEGVEATLIPAAEKGAANGVATLGADGKLPTSQLPPLAIGDTFPVASQAAMLALVAQRGDVAVRTDLDPDRLFILTADDPTVFANWTEITAAGAVLSVNGQSGAVVIPTDGAAATPSLRTLGNGAAQAAAGNDARLSDTRTPTDGSVTTAKIADANVTPAKLSFDPATQVELDAVKLGSMGVVNHGAVAGTARPAGFGAVHWIGSVEPTNAADGDVWTNTA